MAKSVKQKIAKFTRDLKKKAAKNLLVVEDHNDPALSAFRWEQCSGCKFREKEGEDDICGVCKCYLDIKIDAKTNLNKRGEVVMTHCPKGFWDDEEVAERKGRIN